VSLKLNAFYLSAFILKAILIHKGKVINSTQHSIKKI